MNPEKVILLWEKYNFLDCLKEHSIRVTAMALFIADKFIEEGKKVDKELVKYGALLHDIGKMHNINNKDKSAHNSIGKDILLKEGYSEIANIAHEHFIDFIVDSCFTSIEAEIVAIADCLVNPDGFVTFSERFNYGKKRYPQFKSILEKGEEVIQQYFKRLFDDEENFRKISQDLTEKINFKTKTYKQLIEEL